MHNLTPKTIGLLGARGHVGHELLRLINQHPGFALAWASSREKAGQPLADELTGMTGSYCLMQPEDLSDSPVDIYVLALPNGLAEQWVTAIEAVNPDAVIIDLSADYRFTDTTSHTHWQYGLTEFNRDGLRTARYISNPGCYASALQLAVRPLLAFEVSSVTAFGVSGYSGAGTKPSPNNDPERLHDNLKAYTLVNHVHEREVSRQLDFPVSFTPTVAAFFRGIQMTSVLRFANPVSYEQLQAALQTTYKDEALITVTESIPEIRDIRNSPYCHIGGLQVSADGQRAVVISVLDNLLKGAASQALQNLNLACSYDETTGLQ